jgi:hypothetical protein
MSGGPAEWTLEAAMAPWRIQVESQPGVIRDGVGTVYISIWHLAGELDPLTIQLNMEWTAGMEQQDIEARALHVLGLQSEALTRLIKFEEAERS